MRPIELRATMLLSSVLLAFGGLRVRWNLVSDQALLPALHLKAVDQHYPETSKH